MQGYKKLVFLFVFLNWFVGAPILGKDDSSNIAKENETIEKKEVEDNECDDFELGEDELVEDDENPEDAKDDDPHLRDTPPSRFEAFFRSWTAPIALYFINKWTAFKMYFFVKSQVKKRKKQCKHPNHFHTPCTSGE